MNLKLQLKQMWHSPINQVQTRTPFGSISLPAPLHQSQFVRWQPLITNSWWSWGQHLHESHWTYKKEFC